MCSWEEHPGLCWARESDLACSVQRYMYTCSALHCSRSIEAPHARVRGGLPLAADFDDYWNADKTPVTEDYAKGMVEDVGLTHEQILAITIDYNATVREL